MLDGSYMTLPMQLVPPAWSNWLAHLAARLITALRLRGSAAIRGHAIATSPSLPGGFTEVQRHWISEVFNDTAFPRAFLVEQAVFGVLNSQLVTLRRTRPLTPPIKVVSPYPVDKHRFGCSGTGNRVGTPASSESTTRR